MSPITMAKTNATIVLLFIVALAVLTGLALVIRSILDRNKTDKGEHSSNEYINIQDDLLCPETSSQTYSCKPSKESFSKTHDYNPSAEETIEHYSAVVKFITAPVQFKNEIKTSNYNEKGQAFHCLVKQIITDAGWDSNLPSNVRDESLLKIHALLGISKTQNSNPLYDIIDRLATNLDEEQGNGRMIFKNRINSQLKLKCGKRAVSTAVGELLTTIEAITDENRRMSPLKSIDSATKTLPKAGSMKKQISQHARCPNDLLLLDLYPKMAVIFSCKSIGEENSIKSIYLNMLVHEGREYNVNYIIKAILYLDRSENENGVYRTEVFNKEDNLQERCGNLVTNEKIQVLHFLYERQ
ncbi:hypothetical protein ENBRE01_2447 [Enteropsectra breve]|nr:hypothetical protein ENBRE01_2447 [Enteropsectra breve]